MFYTNFIILNDSCFSVTKVNFSSKFSFFFFLIYSINTVLKEENLPHLHSEKEVDAGVQ